MTEPKITFDHCVINVSDRAISDAFYARVLGIDVMAPLPNFRFYRMSNAQLNVHGPDFSTEPDYLARIPVAPGNSDLCFEWDGPIAEAVTHLTSVGVTVESGPLPRSGLKGQGTSIYFRDPDGSLLEFISYA